ncbi:MAG: NAD-dependent deacylase [Methanophagales archaeon ANME-1-THS]|nr:MAG: NAD-dependent deacylase [Methanophagales archaeon ANME-1-THS]
MELLERLTIIPDRAQQVVVLTGAGISAESGVPIFRGTGSMWEDPLARRLAARAGPPWNTKATWEFYEWRRALVARCEPNTAHRTLVAMESYFTNFCLITQNVDGLHRRAGSKNLLELHGNMWQGRCPSDGALVDLPDTPLSSLPPYHSCGTALRPHVVQFGEPIDPTILSESLKASMRADLFFVIGTSGVVAPARDLPLLALNKGAKVIEINREETVLTPHVTVSIRGKAAEILPRLWNELLEKAGVRDAPKPY